VNQHRTAGLFLGHQLIHLLHALPSEDQIQLEPFIRFLDQSDLIGFI